MSLPIFRIASIQPDGGVSTQSCSDGEADAMIRFESMRDSGKNLAVYLLARGVDGRVDETKVIRAWARTHVGGQVGEWWEVDDVDQAG